VSSVATLGMGGLSQNRKTKGYGNMKQWYEELFENYGRKYDNESFTQGTIGECDFIEKEIGYDKGLRILDIGCGTGRHAIELTKRGYAVVGVDLSDSQLKRAREKAAINNLQVLFQKHDARNLPFLHEFDVVIMLCEGGFPLMETDEMNYQILLNASNALTQKGKLIFTTLNALFPLFHSVKDFLDSSAKEGNAKCDSISFDLMTFRESGTIYAEDDLGTKKELHCNERYYTPPEITWLLKTLDFNTIDIFGAKLGAFSRDDKLSPEDFEMLVIAEK
jgi:2-polyprenyl-3-methyl-5-hydroxy-6-metoxy-1,4-benzoquinol methylase